jgi:hypothetical protein
MMKRNLKTTMTIVLLALILVSFPMIAPAAEETKPVEKKQEEAKVTGEAAAGILSAYIWRGQELSRQSVVIQPSATVSYQGFTANIWGNLDTRPYAAGDQKYSSNYTETDVTLSYSRKFGIFQIGGGYIYYGLASLTPNGTDPLDSQELFVSAGLDTVLAPTLTVYKEIDHYHQWYATLGVSHTFALHEKIGLKLAGNVSYLLSTDENTYPKNVISSLTVTPMVSYVFALSDDAKYEMKARGLQGTAVPSDKDSSSFLYGGVTLSYTF